MLRLDLRITFFAAVTAIAGIEILQLKNLETCTLYKFPLFRFCAKSLVVLEHLEYIYNRQIQYKFFFFSKFGYLLIISYKNNSNMILSKSLFLFYLKTCQKERL